MVCLESAWSYSSHRPPIAPAILASWTNCSAAASTSSTAAGFLRATKSGKRHGPRSAVRAASSCNPSFTVPSPSITTNAAIRWAPAANSARDCANSPPTCPPAKPSTPRACTPIPSSRSNASTPARRSSSTRASTCPRPHEPVPSGMRLRDSSPHPRCASLHRLRFLKRLRGTRRLVHIPSLCARRQLADARNLQSPADSWGSNHLVGIYRGWIAEDGRSFHLPRQRLTSPVWSMARLKARRGFLPARLCPHDSRPYHLRVLLARWLGGSVFAGRPLRTTVGHNLSM